MRSAPRIVALVLAMALTGIVWAKNGEGPGDAASTDAVLFRTLRDVINRGVALYNADNPAGCYRLFEGSLLTVKPLLTHKPELQQAIDKALEAAGRDPVTWRRAFTLRSALDKVRAELNPNKDKLPKPRVDEEKKGEAKKEADKKEEEKKDGEKKEEKKEGKKEEKKEDKKDGQ